MAGPEARIVKYVLFYESAPDVGAKAASHFATHRARWVEFNKAGTLLMIGTFANPQDEGSMAIFTSREAAEEFARSDPFVLHGVVQRWYIREWNEALA
ncbi:MAG: YciI family protein [Candidatus Limnocylindrales bacterium]